MSTPGIDPITATTIFALAPPPESFSKGRDFAAWLGPTPRQHSSGGKEKLGERAAMRRLLIIDSSAVELQVSKQGTAAESWLEQMLARKPRMLVTVALATGRRGSSEPYSRRTRITKLQSQLRHNRKRTRVRR